MMRTHAPALAKEERGFRDRLAGGVPGVSALARVFARMAAHRTTGVPTGLLGILPVAIAIDLFDVADEVGGPIGMAFSFVLESAFLLGVTGRAGYAFGFAGFDVIPGLDIVPFATITVLREIVVAWKRKEGPLAGRVIDV